MPEQLPEQLREKVQQLALDYQQQGKPTEWFESLYQQAQGDPAQIPWAKLSPHPILQDWLDQSQISGQGKTALVIGCGLGDDAEILSDLGYQVTAFDISETAINWCRQRFPNSKVNYVVADLLALDPNWKGNFNFVFECRTIQSLPLNLREKAISAIAQLVAPKGTLIVITGFRETEDPPKGPPWPLSEVELSLFKAFNLEEVKRISFTVPQSEALHQLRLEYLKQ
ncbi:Methyltransferase type 11 [Gloeothece citriformis PCC 7424]|uniref:Methyltransferase type 11 n=1 Tax=Gloeothece citriformis (strain PCC 7424) TaxID=65393 RepID=B7KJI5_GLOC7|nr:class I SAM-dependent methyltransferase [Gloeothece citriformis]ACK73662.1 Methyltransferase type 11 [Gloeothece citriformis PCC 7424]